MPKGGDLGQRNPSLQEHYKSIFDQRQRLMLSFIFLAASCRRYWSGMFKLPDVIK